MKTIIIFFIITLFFSCKKTDLGHVNKQFIKENYTLEFEVESEDQTNYEIQTSLTGKDFQTIGTMPYDINKHGVYQFNLDLAKNEEVRLKTINNSGQCVYSAIVLAK